jgi:hypothetical protein
MSLKQTVNLENQLRAQLKKKLKLSTKLAEKWKIRKLGTKMKKNGEIYYVCLVRV